MLYQFASESEDELFDDGALDDDVNGCDMDDWEDEDDDWADVDPQDPYDIEYDR